MVIKEAKEKRIYVFMGSYAMIDGKAKITYSTDKSFVYKKYRDLETGNTVTVNKTAVEAFEKENDIIFTIVDDYTSEEYEKTYEIVKKTYEEEMRNFGNKEEAYKLIKRLTPLK